MDARAAREEMMVRTVAKGQGRQDRQLLCLRYGTFSGQKMTILVGQELGLHADFTRRGGERARSTQIVHHPSAGCGGVALDDRGAPSKAGGTRKQGEPQGHSPRQMGIHEESHGPTGCSRRVWVRRARIGQDRAEVVAFEVLIVGEDLIECHAGTEELQDRLDRATQTTHARLAVTHSGVDRDPREKRVPTATIPDGSPTRYRLSPSNFPSPISPQPGCTARARTYYEVVGWTRSRSCDRDKRGRLL